MAENITYEKIDFNKEPLEREYYKCSFVACDFMKLEITDIVFDKCEFKLCNFSLTKFMATIRDVKFIECKMTGVDFLELKKFSNALSFERSHLNYAIFTELKLHKMSFVGCNLNEAYFDNADITSTIFDHCDLDRASFVGTNLEKVDFSSSYNFAIDPSQCKLKKTIFSEHYLRGLVAHLDIVIQ